MDRNLTPELMDDPALDPARHGQALRGLARLNRVSGADRIPWHAIRDWARGSHGPFTLLDVATGSGDVPLGLAARAGRAGLELRLHGCDVSPVALEHARERSHRAGVSFECIVQDAVHEPFTRRFDVVTCNLFLHHLDEADAVSLLRNAAAACSGSGSSVGSGSGGSFGSGSPYFFSSAAEIAPHRWLESAGAVPRRLSMMSCHRQRRARAGVSDSTVNGRTT